MRQQYYACKVIDKRRLQIDVDDKDAVLDQVSLGGGCGR
jgi:hypothetical protein